MLPHCFTGVFVRGQAWKLPSQTDEVVSTWFYRLLNASFPFESKVDHGFIAYCKDKRQTENCSSVPGVKVLPSMYEPFNCRTLFKISQPHPPSVTSLTSSFNSSLKLLV
jgi:hypothetical protein